MRTRSHGAASPAITQEVAQPRKRVIRKQPLRTRLARALSPAPEVNVSVPGTEREPVCVHCGHHPFVQSDPNALYPPKICADSSTQTAAETIIHTLNISQSGDDLTVLPAQTPTKRTREESDDAADEPSAKRHQPLFSPAEAGQKSPSTPLSLHKTSSTMTSEPQALSVGRSPRPMRNLHIRRNMTYGQMNRVLSRTRMERMRDSGTFIPPTAEQLAEQEAEQKAKQEAVLDDLEGVDQLPLQTTPPAVEQRVPQTAPPQLPTSIFGSIRSKATAFIPQLPLSVAKLLSNPFAITPATPSPLEARQTSSALLEEPAASIIHDLDIADDTFMAEYTKNTDYRASPQTPRATPQRQARINFKSQSSARHSQDGAASNPPSQSTDAQTNAEQLSKAMTNAEREEYFRVRDEEKTAEIKKQLAYEADHGLKSFIGAPIETIIPEYAAQLKARTTTAPKSSNSANRQPTAAKQTEAATNKRKRLPRDTDGSIPPPAGTSYGIDDRYVDEDYNSDSYVHANESEEETPVPTTKRQRLNDTDGRQNVDDAFDRERLNGANTPRSVLKKSIRNGPGTTPRSNKRVTWDDSPLGTPSKVRAGRAGEYTGTTFAMNSSPTSEDETTLSNSPDTKANTVANAGGNQEGPLRAYQYAQPTGFVPTPLTPRSGVVCLAYDEDYFRAVDNEEMDEDMSYDMEASDSPSGPGLAPVVPSPPPTPRIPHAALPAITPRVTDAGPLADAIVPAATSVLADLDAGIYNTAAAEKGVLADASADALNKARSTAEKHKSNNPSRLSQVERARSLSPPTTNNEYHARPEGYPEAQTYVEAGICSQKVFDYLNSNWAKEDDEIGAFAYQKSLEEFTAATYAADARGEPLAIDWGDGTFSFPASYYEDEEEEL